MLVLNSGVKRMNNDAPCIPFNSLCFPCKETSFSPVMLTKGTIQPIFISAIKSDSPSNLWELVTGRSAYAGKDGSGSDHLDKHASSMRTKSRHEPMQPEFLYWCFRRCPVQNGNLYRNQKRRFVQEGIIIMDTHLSVMLLICAWVIPNVTIWLHLFQLFRESKVLINTEWLD